MLSSQFMQIGLTIVFLFILNNRTVQCRPEYGGYYVPRHEVPEMIIEDPYYAPDLSYEIKKLEENDPNFLPNWPYLRELLPVSESYEASTNKIIDIPVAQLKNRFIDYVVPKTLPTPLPLQRIKPKINQKTTFKAPNEKKNANSNKQQDDMHSCHFKICNMGRKRDLRFHQY